MDPRPPVHHEVFRQFKAWSGDVPEGFVVPDFLGVLTRGSFFQQNELNGKLGRGRYHLTSTFPRFGEEYFEWLALLSAVVAARDVFIMMELGAGYGRWLARGAAAARTRRLRYRLIGVEPEPTHFEWMRQHLQDNNICLREAELIQAAVSSQNGTAWFTVGNPAAWYGQQIASPEDTWYASLPGVCLHQVKTVDLASLLRHVDRVDLIDLDVQGAELDVLTSAQESLCQKVGRVYVGTHSAQVEVGLRRLMGDELGWTCVHEYPFQSRSETPWGTIAFQDGVQYWRNPGWNAIVSSAETESAPSR